MPRRAELGPRLARKDAAPVRARGDGLARTGRTDAVPRPVRAEATGPLARLDARAVLPDTAQAQGAGAPEGTLEQRIARLARSAALSPREHEVLQLLLLGRNYAEIGTALQITPRTARFHQHNILEKIGAESRLDIVRLLL